MITKADIQYAFKYYDSDGNGHINADDLNEIYLRKGKQIKAEELEDSINECIKKEKGEKINSEKFFKII